ncbi:MAG: metal-dependent transcriptional regulator [Planctomycetes bacterium]|nr:metal-dependent transcriptional regulator [Planctomycetota bacterium]
MPSSTVENYLKRLFIEQQKQPGQLVQMGHLAEAMKVTAGTATSMIKALADSGLVDYEPRNGVKLNVQGEQLALHVLRRHRLIELFLVQILGLDWAEVHPEAEQLEHAVSEKVLERMDGLLGRPNFDPHGDPIPSADGIIRKQQLATLLNCPRGQLMKIARIVDQDTDFLQFLDRHALRPGATLTLVHLDTLADAVTLQLGGERTLVLGTRAASKILVEPA